VAGFLDDYLPYLLQRADQLLSARLHERLAEQRLQTSEWRVLAVLADDGPLPVGTLTRRCLLPQPTTTHAVSRLEERQLVRRRSTADDGRRRIVELTATGKRTAKRLLTAATNDLADTFTAVGLGAPSEEFLVELRKLVAVLDGSRHD
jgi:DNA-binding MarR family transcriptional regulator